MQRDKTREPALHRLSILLIPTVVLLTLQMVAGTEAATPPPLLNYQGILRDAQGAPLNGAYDMVFRLFDAATGGGEILADQHLAAGTGAVQVTGGVFNVDLGGGAVSDGAGVFPGDPYTSLDQVYRDFSPVFLQIEIRSGAGFETLSPRIQVKSTAYALNTSSLNGRAPSYFLDTSTTPQTKQGPLAVQGLQFQNGDISFAGGPLISGGTDVLTIYTGTTNPGYLQMVAGGSAASGGLVVNGGGAFNLYSSTGEFNFYKSGSGPQQSLAKMLNNAFNVFGPMSTTGGATIGGAIDAAGSLQVNHQPGVSEGASLSFQGRDATLQSGVSSTNRLALDAGSSQIIVDGALGINLQPGNGVVAFYGPGQGQAAAYFDATTGTFGSAGTFESHDGTFNFNSGKVGIGPIQDINGSVSTTPTHALTAGSTDGDTLRLIANGAFGSGARLDFGDRHRVFLQEDVDDSLLVQSFGRTAIMGGNVGIGTTAPATKLDVTGTFHATGTKNFVQNHPSRADLSVVYTALEGDEAGTYTRGSGRLVGGVACVLLGETFALVTNPEVGLTAHLTPRGGPADLYVESIGTRELVVRASDPRAAGAAFDYIVHGLRIGYEEHAVLQPRAGDAPVPSPAVYDEQYAGHSERRGQDALQRFRRIETDVFGRAPGDMTSARDLRRAIGEFDLDPERAATSAWSGKAAADRGPIAAATVSPAPPVPSAQPGSPDRDAATPPVAAGSAPPAPAIASQIVSLARVAEGVEAGDVLILDPGSPTGTSLARSPGDARVFGVVAEDHAHPATAPAAEAEDGSLEVPVALAGVALCKVDATYGPVRVGDLLITSPTPGQAMRADAPTAGTVLGKALEPLASGSALLHVLVLSR